MTTTFSNNKYNNVLRDISNSTTSSSLLSKKSVQQYNQQHPTSRLILELLGIILEESTAIASPTEQQQEIWVSRAEQLLNEVTLDMVGGILGYLDGILLLADCLNLVGASVHLQWIWLHRLAKLKPISSLTSQAAEVAINRVVIDNSMGGADSLARFVSLSLVDQLLCKLDKNSRFILAQMSILAKNILFLLEDSTQRDYELAKLIGYGVIGRICLEWERNNNNNNNNNKNNNNNNNSNKPPPFHQSFLQIMHKSLETPAISNVDCWCQFILLRDMEELGDHPGFWQSYSQGKQLKIFETWLDFIVDPKVSSWSQALLLRCFAAKDTFAHVLNIPDFLSRLLIAAMFILAQDPNEIEQILEVRTAALCIITRFIGTNADLADWDMCELLAPWDDGYGNESSFRELSLLVVTTFTLHAEKLGLSAEERAAISPSRLIPNWKCM